MVQATAHCTCPSCQFAAGNLFPIFRKNAWRRTQISRKFSPSRPTKGAIRDRHVRGAGSGGRRGCDGRARLKRTAKSCGPDTPTLVSSSWEAKASRGRRWPKRPEHRGERDISRRTIARGVPGDSGVTCMLVCAFYSILHTRPRGASAARHSLRPYFGEGGNLRAYLGRRASRDRGSVFNRHCEERSDEAIHSFFDFLGAAKWIASLRSQ